MFFNAVEFMATLTRARSVKEILGDNTLCYELHPDNFILVTPGRSGTTDDFTVVAMGEYAMMFCGGLLGHTEAEDEDGDPVWHVPVKTQPHH